MNGLMPYTYYTCCVSGIDSKDVVGRERCYYNFRTSAGGKKCNWQNIQKTVTNLFFSTAPLVAPSNLRITELQSRTITLQWDELTASEIAGPQTTYSLSMSASGCFIPSLRELSGLTDTSIIVGSLCPYSTYTIYVRACNTWCGPHSQAIQAQTLEDGKCVMPTVINTIVSIHLLSQLRQ